MRFYSLSALFPNPKISDTLTLSRACARIKSAMPNSSFSSSRRRVLKGIGAAGLTGITGTYPLAVYAQQSNAATLASGGVNYTWALAYVAESGGYWKKNNVDLKTVDFVTGRDAMQALLAGSANFSTTTDTPFVFAILRGIKPYVVANFSRYSDDMKLVVHERSAINPKDPSSIKGKRIATPAGTSGQYALAKYLEFAKLKPGDITEINLAATDLTGALVRGDIDGFLWVATAARAAIKQSGGKVSVMTQDGYEKYFRSHQLLLTNQATLDSRRDLAGQAVRTLLDAEKHIQTNPNWNTLIAPRVRVEADVIKESTAKFEFKVVFDESFLDDLVAHAEWAISAGLAQRPAGNLRQLFRAAIVEEPLRKISPDRVRLASAA